jgi:hypothetical protein
MRRDLYIRRLLALYLGLPHTAARRPSPADKQLAAKLFDQNVPWKTVETALLLAFGRRIYRDPQAPPLNLIRSLAYFLPTIDELTHQLHSDSYLRYLHAKLDHLIDFSTVCGER